MIIDDRGVGILVSYTSKNEKTRHEITNFLESSGFKKIKYTQTLWFKENIDMSLFLLNEDYDGIDNLVNRYKENLLKDIDHSTEYIEVFAVMGSSGEKDPKFSGL